MDREILRRLELLNQLSLSEEEKENFLQFYSQREKDLKALDEVDTSATERMVHVMPLTTVVRDDVVKQTFSREDLQRNAPETDEGYWCVPRVVE